MFFFSYAERFCIGVFYVVAKRTLVA